MARLTKREVAGLTRLRGYKIPVCPACGKEVGPMITAHDVRDLDSLDGKPAHRRCVEGALPEAVALRKAAFAFAGQDDEWRDDDREGRRLNRSLLRAAIAYAKRVA